MGILKPSSDVRMEKQFKGCRRGCREANREQVKRMKVTMGLGAERRCGEAGRSSQASTVKRLLLQEREAAQGVTQASQNTQAEEGSGALPAGGGQGVLGVSRKQMDPRLQLR